MTNKGRAAQAIKHLEESQKYLGLLAGEISPSRVFVLQAISEAKNDIARHLKRFRTIKNIFEEEEK